MAALCYYRAECHHVCVYALVITCFVRNGMIQGSDDQTSVWGQTGKTGCYGKGL